MAGIIVGALHGVSKEELLAARYCPVPGYWDEKPLCPEIGEIAAGSFKKGLSMEPDERDHSGLLSGASKPSSPGKNRAMTVLGVHRSFEPEVPLFKDTQMAYK
jgi:hypothetical protein